MLENLQSLPSPSDDEMNSPEFNAIWDIIKNWDIKTQNSNGYCGGNGSHVKLILDSLKPILRDNKINKIFKNNEI